MTGNGVRKREGGNDEKRGELYKLEKARSVIRLGLSLKSPCAGALGWALRAQARRRPNKSLTKKGFR